MPWKLSPCEEQFAFHLRCYRIPFAREVKFHPDRRWRIDFLVMVDGKTLAVEIDGGVWIQGRHQTAQGFMRDMEKYNAIAMEGIPLMRFSASMVMNGEAINTVRKYFQLI